MNKKHIYFHKPSGLYIVRYTLKGIKTNKYFKTIEEAVVERDRIEKILAKGNFCLEDAETNKIKEYPANIIQALCRDDYSGIDYNYVYENFDSNMKYIFSHLKVFTDREKKVFEERCKKLKTLEEVGKELGITRERVRQIEERFLQKLRIRQPANFWKLGYEKALKIIADENKVIEEKIVHSEKHDVDKIGLSFKTAERLKLNGIKNIEDLGKITYSDLVKFYSFGAKCIEETINIMSKHKINFKYH